MTKQEKKDIEHFKHKMYISLFGFVILTAVTLAWHFHYMLHYRWTSIQVKQLQKVAEVARSNSLMVSDANDKFSKQMNERIDKKFEEYQKKIDNMNQTIVNMKQKLIE